jgi:hypothetical protein
MQTWLPKLIGFLFYFFLSPWGHHGDKNSWIEILYFSLALTLRLKPLGLISVAAAPVGLLDLGSTLGPTPCVKVSLKYL